MSLASARFVELFCTVVEAASFTVAARQLGITPAAVSRAISKHEERLGVVLFRRTTRSMKLTEEGAAYFEQCRQALSLLEMAERTLTQKQSAPRGLVRISLPTTYGHYPGERSDGGNFPLGHGLVHKAPIEALEALVARGADVRAVNDDGFGVLHAAAEVGHAAAVPWLLGKGLDLEARTGRGNTALQIACALGHVDAAAALLDAGADAGAGSPRGTAREIAKAKGKAEVVALLDRRARR